MSICDDIVVKIKEIKFIVNKEGIKSSMILGIFKASIFSH